MTLQEIRSIAKTHNIPTGKLSKVMLIKSIQLEEGILIALAVPLWAYVINWIAAGEMIAFGQHALSLKLS